jgi:Transposase DDE domain
MHTKKDLSFTALRELLSRRFLEIPDLRQETKVKHAVHDVLMSGFAMMFYQDSSLLQFQERLQEVIHQNNLQTLFQVESIPRDSQMREVIDEIESRELEPLFEDFFRPLQRGKHLEGYRVLGDSYVISIDGSGYFGSEKIHCEGCLEKKSKKGKKRYEHQIVQAALMKPGKRQVLPLAPEEVRNTDGRDKQDCEVEAGKRLVRRIRKAHVKLKIILVGDSLYSKQPFMEEVTQEGMKYVLVVKEDDHKLLMEWVNEQRQLKEVSRFEVRDRKGRLHIYEWINEVPLNGNKKTLWVNYVEYWLVDGEKATYHNSWVTDFRVDEGNVAELVRIGRCRWKIENETFNTLKNQGYHIEHNFGHGKKHLSLNFLLLNLLAFLMHQIFELTDVLYQECRRVFGSRRNLWDHLRISIRLLLFPDWKTLLRRLLRPSDFL